MPDSLDAYLDPAPKPRRGNYDELINRHAQRTGLDPEFVRAVVHQESRGNRRAVSPKGAQGLGQLMPATAKRFGVTDPFDPEQNIRGATDYLKFLHDRFKGNRDLVLAGYNAGEGAVDKFKGIPPYRETQNYVRSINARLGRQQRPQPKSDLDAYLDPAEQATPSTNARTTISSTSPVEPGRSPAPLDPLLHRLGRIGNQRASTPQGSGSSNIGELRRLEGEEERHRKQLQQEAAQELRSRRGPYGAPTPQGILALASDPVGSLAGLFTSDESKIDRMVEDRLRQESVARTPDVTAARREYGQMSAPVRSVVAPLERGGAGILRLASGIASLGGYLPKGYIPPADQLSEWAQRRAEITEAGASLAPLTPEDEEVVRNLPEKVATGIADLGVGLASIIALKKATRLSFPQLLALEGALKNSDKPATEQASRAVEGYALGTALERLTSRAANAAISGIPTAAQTGYEVSQGRMAPLDAAIQTGIQAGSGAILTPGRRPSSLERGLQRELPRTRVEPDAEIAARLRGERAQVEGQLIPDTVPATEASSPSRRGVSAAEPVLAPEVRPEVLRDRGTVRSADIERYLDEPQSKVQSPAETQRTEVESGPATTEVGSRGVDVPPRSEVVAPEARTADIQLSEPVAQPQKFYHRDFGEVVESSNQRKVGRNRVRVVAADGTEHVIKRAAMTGAGNQRAVPVREPVTEKPQGRQLPRLREGENYRKPLKEYTDSLYRETSTGRALEVLPTSRISTDLTADRIYLTNSPDLALGQGVNKGIVLEFEPADLQGAVNTSKPSWKLLYDQGQAEFVAQYNKQSQYQRALKSITVKPDVKMSRVEHIQLDRALSEMERQGWVRSETPEGVTYRRPEKLTERVEEAQVEGRPETVTKSVTEPPPESTTSARKAQLAQDRAALDLPELPPAERKSWQRSLDEAKPETATRLADEVLNRPRALSDSETASIVVRAQQVKNEHAQKLKEIGETKDEPTIQARRAELETLEREFDQLTQATKLSGTEKGRALAAQKLTINQDFDLVSLVARFKAAAGREPTVKERAQIEHLSKRNTELEAQLAEANNKLAMRGVEQEIERTRRQSRRTESKAQLDAEWADLTRQFAEIRQREASFFKDESGAFDPEAVKLIARMVRNRVQAGVVSASQLVDDIHAITGGDKRELRDVISGYRTQPAKHQSTLQRELNTLKSELRQLSKSEDIAAGTRSPKQEGPTPHFRRDQARRTQIEKQIADLEAQMSSGEFKDHAPRQPPRYTRETYQLQKELERVRNQYEELRHRAKLGRWGHALHTLSGLRKSWMLSGLTTQVKNIGGTGAYQVLDEVSRLPAVIADAAIAPVTGRRSISGPSPTAMLDSVLHAASKGGREAVEILRTGATKEQLERHQFSEINTGVKLVDYTSNLVFRFMSASDRVFYEQAYKRNLIDRANIEARNEGRGKERARELIDNPPEELDASAKHDALVNTFNNNNRLSDAIRNARARLGPEANFALDMVMPFDRTPTNVISRIIEASPAGATRAVIKLAKSAVNKSLTQEEQRQFSQTMGRATVGTALMGLGWSLADDLLDVDEYKVTLKIGNYRIDLAAISPAGNLIALGARLRENHDKGDAAGAVETLGTVPLQQPLVRGIEDVGNVLKEPKEAAVKSGARLMSSFVPFGGMARDAAKFIDPEEGRYARSGSFRQQVTQGIPGLRQRLPVTERPQTRAERWARKSVRDRMAGLDKDAPPETDLYVTLRTRARRGESVIGEVKDLQRQGKISEQQAKRILQARSRTRLQEDLTSLGVAEALNVYSVMNADEKRANAASVRQKIANSKASAEKKRAFRQRAKELGLIQ